MDLISGVFVLSVVILVVVSIIFGFVICNSITRERRRDEGQRVGDNTNETQLDRIERKMDRSNTFSSSFSFYMFGATNILAGIGFITAGMQKAGLILVGLGLVFSVVGLIRMCRSGWFGRK